MPEINKAKLLDEIDARPEIWLNLIQSLGELTKDEIDDTTPDTRASFTTLLANALAEHTNQYNDAGDLIDSIDLS